MTHLTDAERERYRGQLEIPGWDDAAQGRLRATSAIVVGAGGLGAPAAAYLAAAGVGRIGIVDFATVEVGSLHRQVLQFTPEVGTNKAESIVLKLGVINPEVQAESYPVRIDQANAAPIVAGAHVALDCSNADETRRLVNGACCAEGVPLVVAAVGGMRGFLMSIRPGESACYRCAFHEDGESVPAGRAGGLDAIAGALGAMQALEALKLVTGLGRPLVNRFLALDGRDSTAATESLHRREGCPACAEVPRERQSPPCSA